MNEEITRTAIHPRTKQRKNHSQNESFDCILETISEFRLRRFSGLFWPIFETIFERFIRKLINPSKIVSKIGSKKPKNRHKLNPEIVSYSHMKISRYLKITIFVHFEEIAQAKLEKIDLTAFSKFAKKRRAPFLNHKAGTKNHVLDPNIIKNQFLNVLQHTYQKKLCQNLKIISYFMCQSRKFL
jgi:hypothetical protein